MLTANSIEYEMCGARMQVHTTSRKVTSCDQEKRQQHELSHRVRDVGMLYILLMELSLTIGITELYLLLRFRGWPSRFWCWSSSRRHYRHYLCPYASVSSSISAPVYLWSLSWINVLLIRSSFSQPCGLDLLPSEAAMSRNVLPVTCYVWKQV